MEFSKDIEDREKCNSSTESGWTMYLCSPKNSGKRDIYDKEYKNRSHRHEVEVEDESDDSVTSDASSGPMRLVHSWGNVEIECAMLGNKAQAEEKNGRKYFSHKKARYQKQETKKNDYIGKEAEVPVKCNGKTRKNSWFGKRK